MTFINDQVETQSYKNPISYSSYEEEERYLEHKSEKFEIEADYFVSWLHAEDRNSKFRDYSVISVFRSSIDMAIQKAREMFIVDENDEPDVYPTEYAQSIAFTLLSNLMEEADILGSDFAIPTIAAAEQNSIDLIWNLQEAELIINFPKNNERKIAFIGENRNGDRFRGAISTDQGQINFLNWLLQ